MEIYMENMEKCLDFNEAMDSESKILSLQQQINELKHENAVLAAKLYINNGENYDNR